VNSTDAYRRQARRLRCQYAGRPGQLHQSLRQLSAEQRPSGSTATSRPAGISVGTSAGIEAGRYPASAQGGPARRFADHLAQQMTASVLRYSQRLELLRSARRFGIGRFEANLLIAAVQERRRTRAMEGDEAIGDSNLPQWAAVLVVQSALLLGAWWTLFR